MSLLLFFGVITLSSTIITSDSAFTPIINIENGPIRGEILNTVRHSVMYSSFKGIPYAESPEGYLRFKVQDSFFFFVSLRKVTR